MTCSEFRAMIIACGGNPKWFHYTTYFHNGVKEECYWPYWPSYLLPEELGIKDSWYYLWKDEQVYKYNHTTGDYTETCITREGVEELSKIVATVFVADMLVKGKDHDLS